MMIRKAYERIRDYLKEETEDNYPWDTVREIFRKEGAVRALKTALTIIEEECPEVLEERDEN